MSLSSATTSARWSTIVTVAAVTTAAAAAVLLSPTSATAAPPTVTSPGTPQQAVSCAHTAAKKATKTHKAVKAVTTCLSVGGPAGKRTWARYNGSSWTTKQSIAHVGAAVSCATPTFCVAVGDNDAAVYNGRSWTTPKPAVASSSTLSSVSCATASSCVAVGAAEAGAFATVYNGKAWAKPTTIIKGAQFAPAVSCTTSLCMAVEGSSVAIERKGTWTASGNDNAIQLTAVSCVGSAHCVLTDLYGLALVWNGRTYTPVTVARGVDGFAALDAVSCSSTSSCVIGGSNEKQTAPQLFVLTGTSLSKPSTPKTVAGTNTVAGVDCLSSAFCGVAAEQENQA